MKVFGVTGHSGMGKTTLLERLIPELRSRSLRVSLIKHSDKDIEVDRPGKDSYRLRSAGCSEVLLMGRRRWALMHELDDDEEPTLPELIGRLKDCDLVLVEGFKSGTFPKLEVWRAAEHKAPLPARYGILAVACPMADQALIAPTSVGPQLLALEDPPAIADFVLAHAAEVASAHGARHDAQAPSGEGPSQHARPFHLAS